MNGIVVDGLAVTRADHGLKQGCSPLSNAEDALHRVDDVRRFDLAAVVELCALKQLEGVVQAIRRDRVALGQPWFEFGGVLLPPHQAVVDIEPDGDTADVEGGVRVHGVIVAFVGENEARCRGCLCSCNKTRRKAAEERHARENCSSCYPSNRC